MKQLFQEYRTGQLRLDEVPPPLVRSGNIVVRTEASAISVGTERTTVRFAQGSLLGKALARPDLVRQVIAKVRAEGILPAWRASMGRLEVPVPLGYSSAGRVIALGEGVTGFDVGQRIACSGSGYAGHAETVLVPSHLAAAVPDNVSAEAAAFTAIGAIALHACRVAELNRGDPVAIIGLGLLGQIAVQVLAAWGCRVFGIDLDRARLGLAKEHGAEEVALAQDQSTVADRVQEWAGRTGCRAAILLAATPTDEPLRLGASICGERGRVVAAGLVGLQVPRELFFDKELTLIVPRAWGYGSLVGQGEAPPPGIDEPTARDNLSGFLDLVSKGHLRLDRIITHRFPFKDAPGAYDLLVTGSDPVMGVVLHYDGQPSAASKVDLQARGRSARPGGGLRVGVIGAGLFARTTMLPLLAEEPMCKLIGLATNRPVEARKIAEDFGFTYCVASAGELLDDDTIDAVFIFTRHDSHAGLAARALASGKAVFLEKPVATTEADLARLKAAHEGARGKGHGPVFAVGFNRRFAPATQFLLESFGSIHGPLSISATVNAGSVPAGSWVLDPVQGAGRIVGEACHFVDLVQCLSGSLPETIFAQRIGNRALADDALITMRMTGGSCASIVYSSQGARSYPRERVEVIGDGAVGTIDNFRRATYYRQLGSKTRRSWFSVDRGHAAILRVFFESAASGKPFPIPFESYVATTMATFAANESLGLSAPVHIREPQPGPAP